MNVLRDGGLHHVFAEVRAPSTLGSFLRAFCHGNVRQLDAVHRRLLAGLAARAPLLPGKDVLAYLDIDACQRRVYGVTKQGAAFGAAKIQGKVDQHPGDEAADLQRRARGLGAGDADVAGREAVQPGRISEPHRRLHAGGREQIFVAAAPESGGSPRALRAGPPAWPSPSGPQGRQRHSGVNGAPGRGPWHGARYGRGGKAGSCR